MQNSKLIDYLWILVNSRKFIVKNFFIIVILAVVISLIIPKTFTANTTILPPSDEGSALGLSSFLANLPLDKFGLGGGVSDETFTFIAILNSRTVMETIAEKFHLMKLYQGGNMERTVKALRENVSFEINEEGTITFFASAHTDFFSSKENDENARLLASNMANSFIEELDELNKKIKSDKAKNNRLFIEKRYHENLTDLHDAEEAMKAFQEKHGIVALPEQTEAAILAASEIKARITLKEVEVSVLNQYVSGTHSELEKAKSELKELNKKLFEMKVGESLGTNGKQNQGNSVLYPALDETPELAIQYLRFFREITVQQKIMEFLLPQYEQARIQEAKDTPTVQILDKAIKPIKKSKPKRMIMVLVAGFLSIIFSFLYILSKEYVAHLQESDNASYTRLQEIKENLGGDFRKLNPLRRR